MSATCDAVLSLLASLADGQATAFERQQVDAHVAHCVRCRTRKERLEGLHGQLESLVETEIPETFAEETARAVLEKAASPPGRGCLLGLPGRLLDWLRSRA